jgi:hypothetical protein
MDGDMMPSSSLCTGTRLLGFRAVGCGVVSHIHTEDDGVEMQETNSHPAGWLLHPTQKSDMFTYPSYMEYVRDACENRS